MPDPTASNIALTAIGAAVVGLIRWAVRMTSHINTLRERLAAVEARAEEHERRHES